VPWGFGAARGLAGRMGRPADSETGADCRPESRKGRAPPFVSSAISTVHTDSLHGANSFLEKLTVAQLLRKSLECHSAQRFITVLTRALYSSLS
jgi:hypothetical protein